jgi:hypothetical protein
MWQRLKLAAVLGHPDALVFAALAADATVDVSRVAAVLEVVAGSCRQSILQPLRPFRVGLGEPSHLVGGEAKVAEHGAERLARVDGVEELLPCFGG